ncbi:MAG: GxxExxY protein [Candidatus Moranbacteria bacterium]|nr:GxxExxY protein [Candidatus Moranbacteria bacterium]
MVTIKTPLSTLPAFKKSVLGKLKHLDIATVGDLLFHLPYRYEDYSALKPIGELSPGELCTVLGTVKHVSAGQTFKKHIYITEATIDDGTGTIRAIWFGNRFIAPTLGEGLSVRLSGKVSQDKKGLLFQTPDYERASRTATHTARLIPVYPETAGVTSRFFRWQITEIMNHIGAIPDPMPEEVLKRIHLPSLSQAIRSIHFPENENDWKIARKRFAWDEMFTFQLKALQAKSLFETAKAVAIPPDPEGTGSFVKCLPFTLTRAQERSVSDILADLAEPRPMNRLLNGDVGSGKTVVAALAARATAHAGFQTAILAPTEVLARQHWESLSKLFEDEPYPVALLTHAYQKLGGDTVKKATLVSAIRAGIPKIVIGTHAVLQEDVRFGDLALIIVDEQHRFGVEQRAYLQSRIAQTNTDSMPTQTDNGSKELLFEDLTYKIREAVFAVKKQLGLGHKESIYQKALAEELKKEGLSFNKEKSIDIRYDDKKIGIYRPDFIVENKIVVELKVLPSIGKFEKQQVWHYLKGSEYRLALLVNFGRDDVHIERFIHSRQHGSVSSPHESVLVPHFLTMTATPIPRTLTLAFFGDLDLSLLDELPKSRKPIQTKIARNHADREVVYDFIRKEIGKGRQVFVISPLVEESEALEDVKAATAEAERLKREVFPDLRISLVHGRLKPKEKESVMEDFRQGKSDILVATSVIEVGIDIPNASVILIENAERFGLAQLHQFRGRVGRAEHQSYCFLFPGEGVSPENMRLDALEKSGNGFDIAEADLALRGPGSFFGTRQSGLPDVAMENLTNLKLVELARKEATDLLRIDQSLEHHPLLLETLKRFEERIHLE